MPKRSKQSSAAEVSLAEAKQKVEELQQRKVEADLRKEEAETELERVKQPIAVPQPSHRRRRSISTATVSTCSFPGTGQALLATCELYSPAQGTALRQILEQVGKDLAEAVKQAEAAKKDEAEKSQASTVGSATPAVVSNAAIPAGDAVAANASAARDRIKDTIMELSNSDQSDVAERASLVLAHVDAKRRQRDCCFNQLRRAMKSS